MNATMGYFIEKGMTSFIGPVSGSDSVRGHSPASRLEINSCFDVGTVLSRSENVKCSICITIVC